MLAKYKTFFVYTVVVHTVQQQKKIKHTKVGIFNRFFVAHKKNPYFLP